MTIRLNAMFEEHMSRLIYNWKVAKRRETAQRSRRTRNNNTLHYKDDANSSPSNPTSNNSESDDETARTAPKNDRVNGLAHAKPREIPGNSRAKTASFRTKNGVNAAKIAKNMDSSSTSDEEIASTSFANHKKSDSEDSYKPSGRKRARTYRRGGETSTSMSEEDSDDQPLSVHANTRLRRRVPASSDSGDKTMRTRKCKRPRYFESDSDSGRVGRKNGENSDDSGECMTSVSSRGRIRRLTARARALFRKWWAFLYSVDCAGAPFANTEVIGVFFRDLKTCING